MTTATRPEQLFRLPDLGEGLTEAEIVEWKVAVGDTVTVDQVVVEVETAKAAVEVPVPYAGTVLRLHAEAGSALPVGEPLITVGAEAPAGADGPARGPRREDAGDAPDPVASADAAAERHREEEQAGSGNVLIGYGTGHGPTTSRRRRRRATPFPSATPATAAAAVTGAHAPRAISPLVRRMARDHGVDITGVSPSGPAGVVLRRDVEQAIALAGRTTSQSPAEEAVAPAPAPRGTTTATGPERIPLRGVRRAVADKLSRSRTEIPDATTWVDVDATGLLQAKKALESAGTGTRVGLLALFARICVAGLRRFPELNSTVDTEHREILRHEEVHLGFAAQTERGLVVPVVRAAHLMTTVQLAAELGRLTELARCGNLPPHALTGGTFTLNNYGVFGVDGSTPIINHPEAALLGVGRLVDKPWVVDGQLKVRKVTQLSFSFDHRVCDGGVAGGFLRFVADCVEHPATLLADV
ncbi:dihydrolipoamide acetyltransferase family protein [Streptomyces caniscabiei]|uniref:dihydrolipoamide acetyltransferase family protein n=1 Tax=Streptomyces caniscabiei TaxID=2746961 RepID=UPI0029A4F686|nr:dihydrolipoamide acetyltransferase family protein [Streptomyces caniscabiei]MDX2605029.1 dihydrolipoamide acetyltransferase family protein [Streptomyces caniscabiei]MDX2735581.1 dihydrolipoamide acetyltransferase family protein [Streptomyces caniscabiei]MDX2777016.1 dihydrolipoamide acetyltransferase family protein [Streptomyces caniscabiei]